MIQGKKKKIMFAFYDYYLEVEFQQKMCVCMVTTLVYGIHFSLVPRLFVRGGKEPGIHCLHMCLIIAYSATCISMGVIR